MKEISLPLCVVLLTSFLASAQDKRDSTDNTTEIIDIIEKNASFPGGFDSLKTFLNKNLERSNDCKGRVYVEFVVNRDGTTADFKVVRGLSELCNERALKALLKMPKWEPGTQRGSPIRQRWTLPITF